MKVGEIIAVTTTTFMAQSYELNSAPDFGALLRVHAPRHAPPRGTSYWALCCGAQTGSIEPGRHAVAWGRFEDDEDDLYRRQPQLGQVLRTTFDALLVGYDRPSAGGVGTDGDSVASLPAASAGRDSRDGTIIAVQRVPAIPPRLHALVHVAAPVEVAFFNRDLTYLRFVLRAALPHADDFIAATIDGAYRAMGHDRPFLVSAARTVARLLEPEHERVMNILELLDA